MQTLTIRQTQLATCIAVILAASCVTTVAQQPDNAALLYYHFVTTLQERISYTAAGCLAGRHLDRRYDRGSSRRVLRIPGKEGD